MSVSVRPGPKDILARMGPELYRAAYDKGMSLSSYLEALHPQSDFKDGLSAFERVLKEAGIITTSIPEMGVYASQFRDFEVSEGARNLVPEWIASQYRRARWAGYVQARAGAYYTSDDELLNTWVRPYADQATPRRLTRDLTPAIPLSELVAVTTPIDGDAYRVFYITDNAAEEHMVRVGEGANIPTATLTDGEYTIRLQKYGRALEVTYEALRRFRLDKIAYYLQRLAIQTEADKVTKVIDTIVSGDGNTNTEAEVYNLTTLDSGASAGTLTLKGWLAFKLKFANPYALTTALVQEGVALQMLTLNMGSANVPLVTVQGPSGFGSFRPINPGLADAVALGITAEAPALKIVALDNRLAVERVFEMGANIQEVERWASKQTQKLVFTETEGFACLDRDAAKILNVNA